jgi:hypothetical protein
MNQAGPPLENCSAAASPKWSDVHPRSHAHSSVSILSAALLWLSAGVLRTEPTLIFSDDFNREEVASEREEVGNGWTTNMQRRAPRKRQAVLKDGALLPMTGFVDGAEVGSITSPGVGHPNKRVLEISNNKPVRVDDVKIWSLP